MKNCVRNSIYYLEHFLTKTIWLNVSCVGHGLSLLISTLPGGCSVSPCSYPTILEIWLYKQLKHEKSIVSYSTNLEIWLQKQLKHEKSIVSYSTILEMTLQTIETWEIYCFVFHNPWNMTLQTNMRNLLFCTRDQTLKWEDKQKWPKCCKEEAHISTGSNKTFMSQ